MTSQRNRLSEMSEAILHQNTSPIDGKIDTLNPEVKAISLVNVGSLITSVIDLARAGCKQKAQSFDEWQETLQMLERTETAIKANLSILLKGIKVDVPTLKMLKDAQAQDVQDALRKFNLLGDHENG